jgi:hypothetical protein
LPLARELSTSVCLSEPQLLRDFIHESLYHPTHGYFSRRAPPVGALPEPIDFPSLGGHQAYLHKLQHCYQQLQVHTMHACFASCFAVASGPPSY